MTNRRIAAVRIGRSHTASRAPRALSEATKAGATLRTADGVSDATGSAGVISKGVHDMFAEYERVVISERTTAALAVKRARGERLGGRHLPYGQRLAADGVHLEPDPLEQLTLARARALRATGLSIRAVAEELEVEGRVNRAGNAFAVSNLHAMLQST